MAFRNRKAPTTDEFVVVSQGEKGGKYDPSIPAEAYATGFMEFTDTAPTIYHANHYLSKALEEHGFEYLDEREDWTDRLTKGNKFYTTRGTTTVLAFTKGKHWQPSHGAGIVGTHIDSLTCVVKPISIKEPIDDFELIGVAPYAGALSDLWWDRDLGIGGRMIVREGRGITEKLVRIPHPIARIASLAPHFGKFAQGPFNPETQKVPFIGLAKDGKLPEPTEDEKKSPVVGQHSLRLLRALSRESGVPVRDILSVELHLFDTQPAALGGIDKDFIFAPRVDNKACTYSGVYGFIEAADTVVESDSLSVVVAYDNEEIGSRSRTGAQGNILEAAVDRIFAAEDCCPDDAKKAVFWANSFFLSADVTHATNPNFSDVYMTNHKPKLNKGITVTFAPGGNMITNANTSAFVQEIARRTDNTIQYFQVRNDSPTGGTIGPYLASKTGIRGVDLGIAQLSMHSIRATIGSEDIWLGVKFFKSFFNTWREVDLEFQLGSL